MENSTQLFAKFLDISRQLYSHMITAEGLCIVETATPLQPEYDVVCIVRVRPDQKIMSFEEISENSYAMKHLVSWAVDEALPEYEIM